MASYHLRIKDDTKSDGKRVSATFVWTGKKLRGVGKTKSGKSRVKFSCLKNRNSGSYECFFRYHAAYDYFEALKENDERSRYKH